MFKVVSLAANRNLISFLRSQQKFNKKTAILFNNSSHLLFSTQNDSSSTHTPPHNDQEAPKLNEEQIREKILKNALNHVPNLGFTTDALSQGAMEAGYSAAAKGMFKNGAFDLIDFFYKKSNAELADYLENLVKEKKVTKINELVRSALIYRLGLIQPYIRHWPEAMAVQTFNPSYALVSIENLLRLCDEVWHQIGDTSTDFNWYTKRLSLAAIYKSTELFMIQDKSENFKDTFEFLDNRFNDLAYAAQVNNQLKNFKDAFAGSLLVLKNILLSNRS